MPGKTSCIFLVILWLTVPLFATENFSFIKSIEGNKELVEGEKSGTQSSKQRWFKVNFLINTTIDRVDIITTPNSKITYTIGYTEPFKNLYATYNTEKYNYRANANGVQSIPVSPSITTRYFYFHTTAGDISKVILYRNNKKIDLLYPKKVSVDIRASSALNPQRVYQPENLFDNDLETIWAEGAKGYGKNETLTLKFDQEIAITDLWFYNGLQRDEEIYKSNGRLKDFVLIDDKGDTQSYTAQDAMGEQLIRLKRPIQSKQLTLKIISFYPGTKYEDLCISEFGIKNNDAYYSLTPRNTFQLVKANNRLLHDKNNQVLNDWGQGAVWGISFVYNPANARFNYTMQDPNNSADWIIYKGYAEVVQASASKIIFNLEGYLDKGDADRYGNLIKRKSRSAVKMNFTIYFPSKMSNEEWKEVLVKRGLYTDESFAESKNYIWYSSQLGFIRSF